jgi:hypothetical protein
MVARDFLPYLTKVFHPKVLKIMGKAAPWRALNRIIELTDVMNAITKEIYDAKKRLLESGDSATVKQVGDGKDIISLLSASIELHSDFRAAGLIFSHRSAS